ncbi:MAG: hypothetical protein ACRYHQ_31355 [Janthinobacterium lividum]
MQNDSNTIPCGLAPMQKGILVRLVDAAYEPGGRGGISLMALYGIGVVGGPMRAGLTGLIDSGLAETFDMPVAQSWVAAARATPAGFRALGRPLPSKAGTRQPAVLAPAAFPPSQRAQQTAYEAWSHHIVASFDAAKAKNPVLTEKQHAEANPFVYADFAGPGIAPLASAGGGGTNGQRAAMLADRTDAGRRVSPLQPAGILAWVRSILSRLRRA